MAKKSTYRHVLRLCMDDCSHHLAPSPAPSGSVCYWHFRQPGSRLSDGCDLPVAREGDPFHDLLTSKEALFISTWNWARNCFSLILTC